MAVRGRPGVDELIYLFGGASGIGGGIISSGALRWGRRGAGDFGHTVVRRAGFADTMGIRGTLESEATREAPLEALGMRGDDADPDLLERRLLASTATAALSELARQLESLAVTLATAVNILKPRVIVLGGFRGSLASAQPELLNRLVAARSLPTFGVEVTIRQSELGSAVP